MDDVLRQRLWRHLEALPDAQVYQVLDYIEFLASKYARGPIGGPTSTVQRFGERLQDRLRSRGVGIRAMRTTLDAVGTADRVFAGLTEAGRSLIHEVEEGIKQPPPRSASPTVKSLPGARTDRSVREDPQPPRDLRGPGDPSSDE